MSLQNRAFPYPVLRLENSDYLETEYISEIELVDRVTNIVVECRSKIDNPVLKQLLEEGKIEFIYRIECPKTYFRKIEKTSDTNIKFTLDNNNLLDKVYIESLVVAKQTIRDFYSKDFHQDFKGFKFNFDVGNILGVGKSIEFKSDKNINDLYSVDSIFSVVRRDADQEDGMRVDINGSGKIQISLSKPDYNKYALLVRKQEYKSILNTMIVLPALIWAFENVRLSEDFYEMNKELRWLKSINIVLEGSGLDLTPESVERSSSFELAQNLLGMPLHRSLDGLSDMGEEIE